MKTPVQAAMRREGEKDGRYAAKSNPIVLPTTSSDPYMIVNGKWEIHWAGLQGYVMFQLPSNPTLTPKESSYEGTRSAGAYVTSSLLQLEAPLTRRGMSGEVFFDK